MAKKKSTTKKNAAVHRTKKVKGAKGAAATATEAPPAAKKDARPRPASKDRKRSRPGLLDLAAEVLRKANEPMTCAEMVEAVLKGGAWTTKGRTPAASLNAAIHRELKDRGKDARFKKVERGRFAAQGGGR